MNLVLLQFNNYYNRIIRKLDTAAAYKEQSIRSQDISITNFSPNDSVRTTQVINTATDVVENPFDYLLVCDNTNAIVSRWWIIDATRTSKNQYKLDLLRDVIADNYEAVIGATSFIRKATIRNIDDPALFNLENMTFNRIKFRETLLSDDTQCPWIVGYVPRDAFSTNQVVESEIQFENNAPDITVNGISTWPYLDKTYLLNSFKETEFKFITRSFSIWWWKYYARKAAFSEGSNLPTVELEDDQMNKDNLPSTYYNTYTYNLAPLSVDPEGTKKNLLANLMTDAYYSQLNSWFSETYDTNLVSEAEITALNNKVIYDSATQYYYQITVESESIDTTRALPPALLNYCNENLIKEYLIEGSSQPNTWRLHYGGTQYHVSVNRLTKKIGTQIGPDRTHLEDAPYDMFCIPYGSIDMWRSLEAGSLNYFTCEKEAALRMAQAISITLGANTVYDIQLLPYCPLPKIVRPSYRGQIDISKVRYDLVLEAGTSNPITAIIWCDKSSFSTRIFKGSRIKGRNPVERKTNNETFIQRICSPNYDGIFEFNSEKNDGNNGFVVNCSYKPFNPYIHVAPMWKSGSLYGGNFDDARGLICGGDFSITQLTSAWADYQLQNKNFQSQFDRQVQNLERKQSLQQIEQQVGAFTGTIGGATSGAMTGAMVGGGWGAAIGGVAGGVASGIGGIADVAIGDILRGEEKSYMLDQYGYAMENIQAIPYSLSKVGAFNINYKNFPFLEEYKSTPMEKQALVNKLTYNGMTVMRIDNIANFLGETPSYVQAQLIRLEGVAEDYHMINAIQQELNKGVYI
jgi:hypothetical protein